METVRLALVTDIHAGVERSNVRSGQAITLLDHVVQQASACKADLLVTLGDNVNATSPEHDRHWLAQVGQSLGRCAAPAVPLFGNNEYKFLEAEAVAAALGCAAVSEVRSLGGWTLIFWRPSCSLSLDSGPRLTEADLSWLYDALAAAAYPAVLFLHAPIDAHSMVGNLYFENRPDLAHYANAGEARRLLEASGKVALVMAGHVHWNAGSTINGIHHRTLASLSDTFLAAEAAPPSGTWALLELAGDGGMSLKVFGREPMSWSAPAPAEGAQWRSPLPREAFDARMRALWEGGVTP